MPRAQPELIFELLSEAVLYNNPGRRKTQTKHSAQLCRSKSDGRGYFHGFGYLLGVLLRCQEIVLRLEALGGAMYPRFHVDRSAKDSSCIWKYSAVPCVCIVM